MFESENSSANISNETMKELEGLETAMSEPFVERVLEMCRVYNRVFQESTPTLEEAKDIISELDTEWGSIKSSIIRYTGVVTVRSDDGSIKPIFLDGAQVVSNGFCIHHEPVYVEGRYMGEFAKVKHHLTVKLTDVFDIEKDEEGREYAYAMGDIDSSAIEFVNASPERAFAWLNVSCPELVDEIDSRILNGDGNEDTALLSLSGLDFNQYVDLSDEFTRNCLNIYLNKIIEVDTTAPYSAEITGYVRRAGNDSTQYHMRTGSSLIYIATINMQRGFTQDQDEEKWSLTAHTGIIPKDRIQEVQQFIIPIDCFKTLQSIRNAYYSTNT